LWSGTKENFADVPSFAVLKTQICVTRPQCVKLGTNKERKVEKNAARVGRIEENNKKYKKESEAT